MPNTVCARRESGKDFRDFLLLLDGQLGWELNIEDDVEVATLLCPAMDSLFRALRLPLVFHEAFSLNNFDASRRLNRIDCNKQVSSIKRGHLNRFALDDINQAHLIFVD